MSPAAAKPVAGAAGRRAPKAGAKLIPSPGPGAKSAAVGPPTGQFFLAREKDVQPVQADPSLISTVQLPDSRILELARATGKEP